MTRRIGVMGGMFDPVHTGHISAALAALNRLSLDELRLIPCANPFHRDAAVAHSDDRLAMLKLAVQTDVRLLVDDRELKRQGISYTVDTLRSLHKDFPDSILVLLLGEDAFEGLPHWHRWQELFELCHICVINRPVSGQSRRNDADTAQQVLRTELSRRQVSGPDELFIMHAGRIFFLKKEGLQIASNELRKQLGAGVYSSAASMLPTAVSRYIAEHNLYKF
jgi:nicotinate-nucleotide adenylyltransferase